MHNFTFSNHTEFHFGKDAVNDLPTILDGRAKKIMLLFGGRSAKANGAYDQFHNVLEGAGIDVVDFGGVTAPDNRFMLQGIETAKREQVDGVIGIGGSCCMDFAKLVAFGAKNEPIWDWLDGTKQCTGREDRLLVGAVPTFPGGGSEADGNGEVDDFERSVHGTLVGKEPDFAILDPTYTYTLNLSQTATGAFMAFCQLATMSLGAAAPISDALSYGSMRAIVAGLETLRKDLRDYDARSDLMWAATMSTLGLAVCGKGDAWGFSIYDVMAGIRLAEEQPYRVAFPILLPHWLKAEFKYHSADVKKFFVNVFGVSEDASEEEALNEGLAAMEKMYRDSGRPWYFDEVAKKLPEEQVRALAEEVVDQIDLNLDELTQSFLSAVSADYDR